MEKEKQRKLFFYMTKTIYFIFTVVFIFGSIYGVLTVKELSVIHIFIEGIILGVWLVFAWIILCLIDYEEKKEEVKQ